MTVLRRYSFVLGLCLLVVVACVLAPILSNEVVPIGGWVVSISTAVATLLIAVTVVVKAITSQPEFVTSHGVQVWYDGDAEELKQYVTKGSVERFYDAVIPVLEEEAKNRCLPIELIRGVVEGTRLFVWDRPITAYGLGWVLHGKAGICDGRSIAVQWLGSWWRTELDHEMLHQFQPILTGWTEPDYKHEDASWWGVERRLEAAVTAAFGEG